MPEVKAKLATRSQGEVLDEFMALDEERRSLLIKSEGEKYRNAASLAELLTKREKADADKIMRWKMWANKSRLW